MKRQNLMWIFVCFALSFFTVDVGATPLPDTGVTKCYSDFGSIICPSLGQPFYGQDAINLLSYTKMGILHLGLKVVYTFRKPEFGQSYSVGNN